MAGYFSEIDFFGTDPTEFIEVAVPAGTVTSGYTVQLYDNTGSLVYTFSLGAVQTTIGGKDVYVIDNSNPAFNSSGDPMGVMYDTDAMALVDGTSSVQQFVSWNGNTVTATSGDANGLTSTDIGTMPLAEGHSLQSDDGGSTYYVQTSTNKGTIPACYTRGTYIDTPDGPRRIEDLSVGDKASCASGGSVQIRWLWKRNQTFSRDDPSPPIRIKRGCFGPDLPNRDLVVSAQHRIALGCFGQLSQLEPAFAPAIGLTGLSGVHAMKSRAHVQWWHIVCDDHVMIRANGLVSETMLLGPLMFKGFTLTDRRSLRRAMGLDQLRFGNMRPALPCMGASSSRRRLMSAGVVKRATTQNKKEAMPQSHV